MLKLILIFLIVIVAYAAQTRIKIGTKSWGYQIDLNHGQQIRNEFSDNNGVTTGYYLYRNMNINQTKKLLYTIDPNHQQPNVEFNVINVDHGDSYDNNNDTTAQCLPQSYPSNMTFDSIDSNEEFKGHVTLKVGNLSYSINFATGDKSNSREEILTSNGLLYGRYNFITKNSPNNKITINYKYNSTSADPLFEVSLFKSSTEDLSINRDYYHNHHHHYPTHRDRERERDFSNSINYNPSSNFRAPYHRGFVPATSSSSSSSPSTGVSASTAAHRAAAIARAQEQARQAVLAEKYRSKNINNNNIINNINNNSNDSNNHPNYHQYHHDSTSSNNNNNNNNSSWYHNRSKSLNDP